MKIDRSLLAVAFLLAACGATSGGARFDVAPAPPVPEVSTAKASSPEVGVANLISDAIANLNLTTDQNAQLVAVMRELDTHHADVQAARKALSLDMASSVAAGQVDERALTQDAENLGKARIDSQPADAHAFEELHRVLTPAQRKQFAAALRARAEKLPTDDAQTRYGQWRSDLEISLEQNEKISPQLDADTASTASARAERDAWRDRLRSVADDFEKDAFTAASYVDPHVRGTTVERIRRVIAFLKIVVPVLAQKQRDEAAENLRAEVGVKHD